MAGVLLRCGYSTLRNVAARRVLTCQAQAVRSYCLSRQLLAERKFTKDHEWVEVDSGVATIGVSNYAQEKLGEIVYVQLPDVGDHYDIKAEFGALESVKAASELYAPLTGKITAINSTLADDPSLVNSSPYDKGWLVKMEVEDPKELEGLMDEKAYTAHTEGIDD
ncbi:hypothetical protein QZH41_016228 [Actinostola sp. cb2023]|nr:hypothetical protein QZH41_016228 [Actinostola sp. cb2023]